ncbi:TetR/AcrR family transcriptional regulator [Nocardia speluncae]|uniref:TetR/AcrR family transcriptional regulator n=1 Tax=Nocardia speluncae TaxID=419477 RepID=A0A846XN95_9NOCA|nr:TetR/AcrR family transcriptional regulator [Nocardia speluncae]NKY36130.1 TetR/AcrR family transcriptional regulator [Nocardia speluncae]
MANRRTGDHVTAGRDTKKAILDAAVRLFVNKGFEQTSLREIADAVGITKPSLYYHYSSKLELLVAVIDPLLDALRALADEVETMPAPDTEGRRTVLRGYIRVMIRNRDAGEMMVRNAVPIVNAVADQYPVIVDAHKVVRNWLAGPEPTPVRLLRAAAAMEIVTVALISNEIAPDAGDDVVESTLLDAALAALAE